MRTHHVGLTRAAVTIALAALLLLPSAAITGVASAAGAEGAPVGRVTTGTAWPNADPDQEAKLKSGVEAWNAWRKANPNVRVILVNANLQGANLQGADLRNAELIGARLNGADLTGAYLNYADLSYTDLRNAKLTNAILDRAYLQGANLQGAKLDCYANVRCSERPPGPMPDPLPRTTTRGHEEDQR